MFAFHAGHTAGIAADQQVRPVTVWRRRHNSNEGRRRSPRKWGSGRRSHQQKAELWRPSHNKRAAPVILVVSNDTSNETESDPVSEIVATQDWRSREPEQLRDEWEGCLLADAVWKSPSGQQREVLLLLASMHLNYPTVRPSQEWLAKESGTSRSTVQRVVRDLERAGIQRRKLSRPVIDPDSGQFVSRPTTIYEVCSRGKRRGYRYEQRRQTLRNACKRRSKDQVSLGVTSDARTHLSSSKDYLVVVGPSEEPTQQLPSKERAREIYLQALSEGRSQRRE